MRLDPAHEAHAAVIRAWAWSFWDGLKPAAWLRRRLATAARRMEHPTAPTAIRLGRVRGPATALHATAWRIGWQVNADGLITHTGQLLRWGIDAPVSFEKAVEAAVINWRKANVLQTLA